MKFLICGSDSFRSGRKLNSIRDRFKETRDSTGLNTVTFKAADNSSDVLIESLLTPPFLSEKKLVVAEGYLALSKDDQSKIAAALDRKPDSSVVVFYEKSDLSALSKSPLLTLLKGADFTEEFRPLTEQQAVSFMATECESVGLKIELSACNELFRAHGGGSWALTREISRLCSLALSRQTDIITLTLVKESTTLSQDDSIFEFLDACFEGRSKQAISLLESLASSGTNDLQLLSMMQRQVKLLLGVKSMVNNGQTDRFAAAKRLGMHPFPVGKAMRSSYKFKIVDLRRSMGYLLDLERRIKTGQASSLVELGLLSIKGK